MSNRARLVSLMERLALTKGDVGRIARASDATVDSWLKPETSKSHRACPDVALAVIEHAAGDPVCATASEAAEILGVTAARVRALATDAQVGLGGALWAAGQDEVLARVEAGQPVTLAFGTLAFLVLPGWAFVPLQGRTGGGASWPSGRASSPASTAAAASTRRRTTGPTRPRPGRRPPRRPPSPRRWRTSACSACAGSRPSMPATRPRSGASTRSSTSSGGQSNQSGGRGSVVSRWYPPLRGIPPGQAKCLWNLERANGIEPTTFSLGS